MPEITLKEFDEFVADFGATCRKILRHMEALGELIDFYALALEVEGDHEAYAAAKTALEEGRLFPRCAGTVN